MSSSNSTGTPFRGVIPALVTPFRDNGEASWRGIVRGPGGLDALMAFSLHSDAIRRWFQARGIVGDADVLAL